MADPTDLRPDEPAPAKPVVAEPGSEAPAPAAGDAATPVPAGEGADLGRRRFFRQFAGELFNGAAGVVGAAQAIQQMTAEAASAILDPASMAPSRPVAPAAPVVPEQPTGFRTPFRETPGVLHLVDQTGVAPDLERAQELVYAALADGASHELRPLAEALWLAADVR